MGVKFGREYSEIVDELSAAIVQIGGVYTFFEMEADDWQAMGKDEQRECIRTMADDLFYGLGADPVMDIGTGSVSYDKNKHILKVNDGEGTVTVIRLT
ncbi:hypothetical protein [Paenibacillus hamazuiensis]|uniref:hypothetical protein n=1 Tax=Paenibacillus hamazuiensis TaxID=2936508 RepID=UPI00200BE120|nr:hypothetical protein [Paenibacillus hamazuiensis]